MSDSKAQPTIRDVLAFSDLVGRFIVDHRFHAESYKAEEALAAVHQLTALARKAIETPTPHDLKWAIQNDPIAWAAYNHGRAGMEPPR